MIDLQCLSEQLVISEQMRRIGVTGIGGAFITTYTNGDTTLVETKTDDNEIHLVILSTNNFKPLMSL